MATHIQILGYPFPIEVVILCIAFLGICLVALRLRALLFMTIVVLFLPSMDLPFLAVPSRILRWAFLVGLLGKGLVSNFRAGFRPRPETGAHRIVLFLSVLVYASAFWSIEPSWTLQQGSMMVVLWAGVFLVLWNSWETEEQMLTVCSTLFWFAACLFTLETLFLVLNLEKVTLGRYSGVFLNPNGLGTAVAFLGPFVFWRHRTTQSQPLRLYAKAIGIVMVISLFQSGSRSGLLGALVCMGVTVTYVYRAKVAVLASIVAVPLLLLLVLSPRLDPTVLDETRFIRAESLATLSDRLPMWEKGFDYFLDRPFAGYGYGMNKFVEFGRANSELARSIVRTRGANYHNTYIQLSLDLGLLGVFALLGFLYIVLRRGLEIYNHPDRSSVQVAGIAFFAAFMALFGDSFVHGWMFSPGSSMSIVFWLVSACVIRVHLLSVANQAAPTEAVEPAAEQAVSV